MIAVISPAKTLDFETQIDAEHTLPKFQKQAKELIAVLKDKSEKDIQQLMGISENLAELNVDRYKKFTAKKDPKHAKQAIYAFQGDVYQGFEAETMSKKQEAFAQDHIRILSGLYGVIRPLDLMQPYRLEMGTQLHVNGSKNLYEFWSETIAKQINKDLKAQGDKILVNLASVEYFKSIDKKTLKADIIDVTFEDFSNGEYKIVAFFAKKARGMMSRYIVDHEIDKVEDLKGFNYGDYWFDDKSSSEKHLVFKRG